MDGEGLYEWANGGKYKGQYSQGKMTGKGRREWPGGDHYIGGWLNDHFHGLGTKVIAQGDIAKLEGNWSIS